MPETSEVATVDHSEEHTLKSGEENRSEGSRGTPAVRRRLPDERHSLTHHFSVGGQEGYVTVGLYEDGLPGEMFIRMSKEGSTVSGLMDSFATAVSLALQYGVPLQVLCDNFGHTRFEPSGWSGNPKIGYAKSLMDYLFRWLELPDLDGDGLPSCSSGSLRPAGTVCQSDIGESRACFARAAVSVRNGLLSRRIRRFVITGRCAGVAG